MLSLLTPFDCQELVEFEHPPLAAAVSLTTFPESSNSWMIQTFVVGASHSNFVFDPTSFPLAAQSDGELHSRIVLLFYVSR